MYICKEIAKKYSLEDVIEGIVTRITPFGVFMKLEEGINGLVHLSEISHSLVKDPEEFVQIGKKVKDLMKINLKKDHEYISIHDYDIR